MMGGEGGIATETGLLEFDGSEPELEYTHNAVSGVFENLSELDGAVSVHLVGWTMDRLARVDLAIMRLASWEMLHEPTIRIGVSIDEAAELARRFSTPESVPFITGVLSSVARDLDDELGELVIEKKGTEDE
jgi:N utilization substance protein B